MKTRANRWVAAVAAASILSASAPAAAVEMCGDRAVFIENLWEKFKERRRAAAVTASGHLFEIYASEETGTWTAIVTTADGRSCLAASGEGWREWEPETAAGERPS